MPFPSVTEITSNRLTLRPVESADLIELLDVNSDADVTEFLAYDAWQSMHDAEMWLARMQLLAGSGTGHQMAVVQRSHSRVVGTLQLFNYDEMNSRVQLTYALGRQYWGNGLMFEAISAVRSWAVQRHRIRRIEAEVNPENHAACELQLRLGFTLEGTLRKRSIIKGRAHDMNVYGWLARDPVPSLTRL